MNHDPTNPESRIPTTPSGDEAAVEALCALRITGEPMLLYGCGTINVTKNAANAILAAIREGKVPTVCNLTTNEMTLQAENAALRAKLAAAEARIVALNAAGPIKLQSIQDRHWQALCDAERERDHMRRDLCEIAEGCGVGVPDRTEAKRRIIALRTERDAAIAAKEKAEAALSSRNEVLRIMRDEKEVLQARVSAMEFMESRTKCQKCDELQARVAELEREVSLKADVLDREQRDSRQIIDRLRNEISQWKQQVDRYAAGETKAQAEVARLQSECERRSEEYTSTIRAAQVMRDDLNKAQAEVAKWKANHDNMVAINAALRDRPDLGDRASKVQAMSDRIDHLVGLLLEAGEYIRTDHDDNGWNRSNQEYLDRITAAIDGKVS